MSDSSFDVDEILKEVRKRREENEARIKASASAEKSGNKTEIQPEKKAEKTDNDHIKQNEETKNTQAQSKEKDKIKETQSVVPENHSQKSVSEKEKKVSLSENNKNKEKEEKKISVPAEKATENAQTIHYDVDENGNVDILQYAAPIQEQEKQKRKNKKEKKKASKLTKILRAVIILLVILIIGGAVGIYFYVNKGLDQMTNPPQKTEATDEWTGMDVLKEDFSPIYEDEDVYSYRDMIKSWYYNGTPVSSTHVLNVLLIGEDTRGTEITDEDTRADSAIIVSINADTKAITLTSILRDSYCYYEVTEGDEESGKYGKINEAMMYGGIDCYIRAVENNFKVNIDNYVIVNFDSFASIVDTLGGITVEMTEKEINEINNHPSRYGGVRIDAQPGLVDLNGEQALAFCRIRKIDSDNERANRQKTVLLQIFEKMSGASTVQSLEVANSLMPYVMTGFSKSEIIDIGTYALRHGWLSFTTYTQTVPENTTDENGAVITTCRGGNFYGTWCWKVDFPLTAQLLQQSIYNKTNIQLAEDRPDFDKLPLR